MIHMDLDDNSSKNHTHVASEVPEVVPHGIQVHVVFRLDNISDRNHSYNYQQVDVVQNSSAHRSIDPRVSHLDDDRMAVRISAPHIQGYPYGDVVVHLDMADFHKLQRVQQVLLALEDRLVHHRVVDKNPRVHLDKIDQALRAGHKDVDDHKTVARVNNQDLFVVEAVGSHEVYFHMGVLLVVPSSMKCVEWGLYYQIVVQYCHIEQYHYYQMIYQALCANSSKSLWVQVDQDDVVQYWLKVQRAIAFRETLCY